MVFKATKKLYRICRSGLRFSGLGAMGKLRGSGSWDLGMGGSWRLEGRRSG